MLDTDIYLHSYSILSKKVPHYFIIWVTIHIIFFLLLLVLSIAYQVEKRLEYTGYYQNEVIKLLVDENYFSLTTDEVMIQKTTYRYKLEKIEPIAYESGLVSLWEVSISLDLPENWKIENNQLHLSFLKEKDTIFHQIIDKIKKGMKL